MLEPEIVPDDAVKTHRCCCVTEDPYIKEEIPCPNQVAGSDNPFCQHCEDRHPTAAEYGMIVKARMPDVQA